MNITECMQKITELTAQNLKLLQALNDSFYSRSSHIQTDIDGERFTIPSYLALENKINHLQDAFDNLVHGAQTGSAWMNFNGDSKEIVLKSVAPSTNPINLKGVNTFTVTNPSFFKDMMTPAPVIKIPLQDLPDNINEINVKKIIIHNHQLIERCNAYIKDKEGSSSYASYPIPYSNILSGMVDITTGLDMINGVDYEEYDTVYKLPVRQSPAVGSYVIEEIISDVINDELEEIIKLRISESTPLVYYTENGVKREDLVVGCSLANYDSSTHLKIEDINYVKNIITLRVMHGAYVHFLAHDVEDANIADASRLVFLSDTSGNIVLRDKMLEIPLEENANLYIAIAPILPTTRVQSLWGTGLFINADLLVEATTKQDFRSYYDNNVKNIGDCLNELCANMQRPLTNFRDDEVATIASLTPTLKNDLTNTVKVVQINKHFNDSDTAKTIRSLYSQKKSYQLRMNDVQNRISNIESDLLKISFDDQTGIRNTYELQLSSLRDQYDELFTSTQHIVDNISLSANNSQIPIEAAKFRIRGYVDIDSMFRNISEDIEISWKDIIGVQYRYRYKNPDIPQSNIATINDFLFTDWTEVSNPLRKPEWIAENGKYEFTDADSKGNLNISENNPKFNQVDIPINQGEIVDIQARILWSFGYPFTQTFSPWSDLLTVEFPEDLVKDVQIKTIIDENNDDIETYRFQSIIKKEGIDVHTRDKVQDQDIVYFHKPDNIASGFFTEERRIIPLRDKLEQMNRDITEVLDTINGTTAQALKVEFEIGGEVTTIVPDIQNIVNLAPYSQIKAGSISSGAYSKHAITGPVQAVGVIRITNTTQHNVHLFSMFPGPKTMAINNISKSKRIYEPSFYVRKK